MRSPLERIGTSGAEGDLLHFMSATRLAAPLNEAVELRSMSHLSDDEAVAKMGHPASRGVSGLAVELGGDELVAELALGVVLLGKRFEVGEFGIDLAEVRAVVGGELGPVGARVEGGELLLDEREDLLDLGPLALPGEVDSEGVLLVGHAEPEVVGGDGAQLGGQKVRCDVVLQGFNRTDGLVGVTARHEVFGLELFATGWSEVHAEVRQTLVPGAGDVHLRSAVDGVESGDGVQVFGGELAVIEHLGRVELLARGDPAFDPELGSAALLPVGEQADAVACAEDVVKVVLELGKGQVSVDRLGDLEGGFEVERDLGHGTEQTEVNDGSVELFAVGAGEGVEVTVGVDELDGRDRGGEVPVVDSGAVGSGGDGAGDGDVGQGGKIVQRKALGVDHGSDVAVADTGSDGDGLCLLVDGDVLEFAEGDLGVGAIGEGVEGVPGSERTDAGIVFDHLLELGNSGGFEEIIGVVGEVSRPVGSMCHLFFVSRSETG